jgi:hypothetical protein
LPHGAGKLTDNVVERTSRPSLIRVTQSTTTDNCFAETATLPREVGRRAESAAVVIHGRARLH